MEWEKDVLPQGVYSCWVYFPHFHPRGQAEREGGGWCGAGMGGGGFVGRSCPPTLSIGNSSELGLAVEAGWGWGKDESERDCLCALENCFLGDSHSILKKKDNCGLFS